MSPEGADRLRRLLRPRSIAVAGGDVAAEAVRQCRRIGFTGPIWPIHPQRAELEGLPAFASVEALPQAPDAAFIAVPREATIELVAALQRRGAGGAVCYASGFAEAGGEGVELQRRLVAAAGGMALIGPNCYGVVNYVDGCALWPDRLGGSRVERGVAIVTQSGNIALNLTMHGRHLPIAYMIAVGNKAVSDIHDLVLALLDDPRVTAIGLHIEGLTDVAAFSGAALQAARRGVPVVALKAGRSDVGAALAASHTRSLAGADTLYRALFDRTGIARVDDLAELLETLKLLHACGPLPAARVGSMSCSGGDAALVADLGLERGLVFPELPGRSAAGLSAVLGPRVAISNPLDYHTYIWDDVPALTDCFAAMMQAGNDLSLLVLDFPPAGDAIAPGWDGVLDAFVAARARCPVPAAVASSLPELMSAPAARRLLAAGIAPMQGLRETIVAIAAAARIGGRQRELAEAGAAGLPDLPCPVAPAASGQAVQLDEPQAKAALAGFGLPVPASRVVSGAGAAAAAASAATAIGYPVVVKAVSSDLAHKTEQSAVRLGLAGAAEVEAAVQALAARFDRFLVEKMVCGGLAELIVGVVRDPQFGLSLTIGAGGIFVELLADTATLLLPATREDIERALRGLRCFALLDGYRGRPRADLAAVIGAIEAVARYALAHADRLLELDVNPLIVTADGATAADALIRLQAA